MSPLSVGFGTSKATPVSEGVLIEIQNPVQVYSPFDSPNIPPEYAPSLDKTI